MAQDEIRAEHKRLARELNAALEKAREAEDMIIALMQHCKHLRRKAFFCPDCGADWSADH